ncbi:MAG: carbohydrate ABC transporter permease [Bacillota bacterium]|nr:carbohydrate ABC transporter permease [Bacillota bacterium]
MRSPAAKRNVRLVIRYLILFAVAVPMILPLLWMISTALKEDLAVFTIPPRWIPDSFKWSNFPEGLKAIRLGQRFLNTMFVAALACAGQIAASISVGYALARIRFPGRKLWFYLIIGSMMLPGMVTVIPVFRLFSRLGLYNTLWPLIIPNFFGGPFYQFLTRQFLAGIPQSYDDAARIDGANRFQILTRVLLPLCKPVVATIIIMQFQASWNDYLGPAIYLIKEDIWTLSRALGQFASGNYGTRWNLYMAANIFYILPVLIIFFAFQNYFMQGLGSMTTTGVKA